MKILFIAVVAIYAFSSFTLQVILHELGHFVFGLLSGWRLIYIQVWKLVFYHDHGRNIYNLKVVSCKGFQCIMNPSYSNCNSYGYTLGGILVNFTITILGLIAIIKLHTNPLIFLFILSFTLSGFILLITNGFPRIKNLCNDMACYILTKGCKITSHCHNTQLVIAGELARGRTYARMKEELFHRENNTEINDITAYSIILKYYYHLDKDEFQAAHHELLQINDFSKLSKNIIRIYKLELLYLYMVMTLYDRKPFSSSLLPERYKEMLYVKENAITGELHSLRVRIMCQAYCNMINHDIKSAIEILEKGIVEINHMPCVYLGEKLFCEEQLLSVCNMLKERLLVGG